MKITSLKHRVVAVPSTYPVVSCVRESKEILFVLLDIYTDEGIKGISYVQAFHYHVAKAIKSCVDYLEPFLINEDPRNIELLWKKMWEATKLLGHQGLSTFAVSLIDVALWDLTSKTANMPLYQFLGGNSQNIEAYQSDGLWLESPDAVCKQAEEFVRLGGFTTLKIRLGRKNINDDITLLKQIRETVGDDIELLGDVNQGWNTEITLSMDTHFESCGMKWVEEPINADNIKGYHELSNRMKTPITFGENLYLINSFISFLEVENIKNFTPDLQRVGGITGWKKINVLLEVYNKYSSLHLFSEISVHLFPLIMNKRKLEWVSWAQPLFKEPLSCENGQVKMPQGIGLCLEWDEKTISRLQK